MENKQKNIVAQYMKYYSEVTGKSVDSFFSEIVTTPSWLAEHIVETLNTIGISRDTLLSYKDIVHRLDRNVAKSEGEFYTPQIWCKEAHKYIKDLCGDDWGSVNIWDASCGTGNLLAEIDYPKDKLFCSTLNEEDIAIVKNRMPDVTSFQLDFLSDRDYDSENEFFSEQLPENLRLKLRNNEPILFFMNPPYSGVLQSEVADIMRQDNIPNANEAFCQFYHRIDMLIEYYNLTSVYIAFFHPLQGYKYIIDKTEKYETVQGFCFDRKEFKATANFDRTWYVGLFMWHLSDKAKRVETLSFVRKGVKNDVVVDEDIVHIGNESDLRNQLRGTANEGYKYMPECNGNVIDEDKKVKVKKDSIGYFCNPFVGSSSVATSSWFDTVPYSNNYCITKDSFYKFLPFVLLSIIRTSSSVQNSSFGIHLPDEDTEGYKDWLIDNIPLFLYSRRSRFRAKRGIHFGGGKIDISNSMFPIERSGVLQVIEDPMILEDINSSNASNSFIVKEVQENYDKFSKEAKAFFDFCTLNIIESLKSSVRGNEGYTGDTVCWDAGIYQIRQLHTFWTPEKDKTYSELQDDLVQSLMSDVYNFGIIDKGWKR